MIKIVSTFDDAKKWERETSKKLIELEFFYAKYLLSIQKPMRINKNHRIRKNKQADNYFQFMRANKFDGTESRSSAFFHSWDVEQ